MNIYTIIRNYRLFLNNEFSVITTKNTMNKELNFIKQQLKNICPFYVKGKLNK